jgi:uncharacterized protein (TIGR02118 family)
MIKLTYAIRKHPDLSDAEFHRYWKDEHGPFVAKLAATVQAKRYVQSHLIETPINDILRQSRGHEVKPFDGLTEIWWDSVEAFMAGNGSPEGLEAGAQFVKDEQNFVDHANSVSFITVENTVFDHIAE